MLTAIQLMVAAQLASAAVTYPDFASLSGLVLSGHAEPVAGRLRLSPAIGGLGKGAVWLDTKQSVRDGFDTTFQIQITDKYVHGADGLALVICNEPEPRLGAAGGSLGFGNLTNTLAVYFDDYHWATHTDGGFDEIGVDAASSTTLPLWNDPTNMLAATTNKVAFSDGAVHTARIRYVPGNLQVFIDDLQNPLMTTYINLARYVDLDDGRAWVGVTAASGADWENHDLLSWSFNPMLSDLTTPSPPSAPSRMPSPESDSPADHGQAVYAASVDASSLPPLASLPLDPAFGYRLPGDVALTHQIEASLDLVHWTTLTNAILYFRDPDSTNFTSRYYRFRIR